MDKNRIFIATFSEGAVDTAKEYGFGLELNHLCISENLNEENSSKTLKYINQDIYGFDSEKIIVHGPFTELNPSSIDPRAVELAKERYREAYAVCRKINVKKMVVHSGFIPLIYYRSWHIEKSVPFWKEVLSEMDDDFELYIENVFESEPHVIAEIVDGVDDRRFKVCLDIGHANAMTEDKYTAGDWIKALGKRVKHFHVHNNFGDRDAHNDIDDGNMDVAELLKLAQNYCDKDFTLTVESHKSRNSCMWLKQNFGL